MTTRIIAKRCANTYKVRAQADRIPCKECSADCFVSHATQKDAPNGFDVVCVQCFCKWPDALIEMGEHTAQALQVELEKESGKAS